MATIDEVDAVLGDLLQQLGGLDTSTRSLLPSRRTIEARCPDIDLVRHAEWHNGTLTVGVPAPERRADIRVSVTSDDLLAMHHGELTFARAYAQGRVRLDASVTDLLRLRALL